MLRAGVFALALGGCNKAESAGQPGGGEGGGGGPPAMPVEVAVARTDTVIDAILATGQMEAMQSITLKVGLSSVKIDQTGVTVTGMMVKIDGQVMTDVKGLMTTVKGTAMLQLGGGILMLG